MSSSHARVLLKKGFTEGGRLEGLAAFGVIWLGQVVSWFGSHLTGFAIGVWVYQGSKSATDFSLIFFFSILPEIVLSPIAGVMVDRWDRRRVMMVGDVGAGLCTAALALFAISGQLQMWKIYAMVAMTSAFHSVHFPALSSAITLLIPKRHLSRANGLVELGSSLALVASPMAGAVLLEAVGLTRLLLIDFATYVFAVLSLVAVRIRRTDASAGAIAKGGASFLREAALGWQYVKERPGLLALLALFAVTNFILGSVEVLLTPLVLSFAPIEVLGRVMSAGGVGVVLGSLLVTAWGGPKRKMLTILGLAFVQGAILFVGALEPRATTIGAAAFAFLFCTPIVITCSQTIWQSKVIPEIQGRAFAIRRVVAWSSLPLAYLSAGPLADRVFEPAMRTNGLLAPTIGSLIGSGPGRGIALFFIVMGALTVLAATAGFQYRPLRELEARLPDIPDHAKQLEEPIEVPAR